MLDDIVRHVGNTQLHVFVVGHGGVEVKILYIQGHTCCVRCADGAVMRSLTVRRSAVGVPALPRQCTLSPLLLTLFDLVPQNFRSNEAGDEDVGHVRCSVLWDLVFLDEDNGVGAGVAIWHSLGKFSDFISI